MAKIIVHDYLVALKYIVDGYQVKRMGNEYVGVYWELTKNKHPISEVSVHDKIQVKNSTKKGK